MASSLPQKKKRAKTNSKTSRRRGNGNEKEKKASQNQKSGAGAGAEGEEGSAEDVHMDDTEATGSSRLRSRGMKTSEGQSSKLTSKNNQVRSNSSENSQTPLKIDVESGSSNSLGLSGPEPHTPLNRMTERQALAYFQKLAETEVFSYIYYKNVIYYYYIPTYNIMLWFVWTMSWF